MCRLCLSNGHSIAHGDAFGIKIGKTGFSEATLRLFDVVGHAAEFHAVRSRMIDHVTGPWVVIAWLSHAPDTDGVAAIRIQGDRCMVRCEAGDLFAFFLPDGGNVGMTEETDAGRLLREVLFS